MRSFYETEATPTPAGSDRAVRLFLQLAVLAFWGPCTLVDLYILWRGWGSDGAAATVFWLLFRQALVFLALWFAVSLSHGLMLGRRHAEPRRKKRAPDEVKAYVAPTRHNRGQ